MVTSYGHFSIFWVPFCPRLRMRGFYDPIGAGELGVHMWGNQLAVSGGTGVGGDQSPVLRS